MAIQLLLYSTLVRHQVEFLNISGPRASLTLWRITIGKWSHRKHSEWDTTQVNCSFSILRRLRSVGQNMETGKEEESILFSVSACLLWKNKEEWSALQQWGFRWDIRKNFLTVSLVGHNDLRYLYSCLLMRLKNRWDKCLPSITDIQLLLPWSKGMDCMICGRFFHACLTNVPTVVYNYYGLFVLMYVLYVPVCLGLFHLSSMDVAWWSSLDAVRAMISR